MEKKGIYGKYRQYAGVQPWTPDHYAQSWFRCYSCGHWGSIPEESEAGRSHIQFPSSHSSAPLAEIALQLPDDAVINIPADDKNAMVKVVNNNGSWKRQDNGEDVSNIPFSGVFSIYYESSKTPSYITVSSKHQTNK